MPHGRLARGFVFAVGLLVAASGCQALSGYRPVDFLTRDAETGKPIPGADVHLSYPMADSPFAPCDASGTTGPDGVVQLRARPYGDAGITVLATARGYLPEELDLSEDAIAALTPAGLFRSSDRRASPFVMNVYAEPGPTVELVVPAGYRGLVKAEFHVQDDAPCPPGQRRFTYTVPPSAVVALTGPRLLRHVFPADFHFSYADGQPLTLHAAGSPVGFWWLRSQGRDQVFVIGTPDEYEDYRRDQAAEDAGLHVKAAGQGEGRGRHGGRGHRSSESGSGEAGD